jgi:hypothetical protein
MAKLGWHLIDIKKMIDEATTSAMIAGNFPVPFQVTTKVKGKSVTTISYRTPSASSTSDDIRHATNAESEERKLWAWMLGYGRA